MASDLMLDCSTADDVAVWMDLQRAEGRVGLTAQKMAALSGCRWGLMMAAGLMLAGSMAPHLDEARASRRAAQMALQRVLRPAVQRVD